MKYPLQVSGDTADRNSQRHSFRSEYSSDQTPVVRRFPPALQFLTRSETFVETELQATSLRTIHEGKTIDQICEAIFRSALSLGYTVTIGLQEVYSSNMPSFPNETIMSCLIMVDFTPLQPKAKS
jgi:hypothetical protein